MHVVTLFQYQGIEPLVLANKLHQMVIKATELDIKLVKKSNTFFNLEVSTLNFSVSIGLSKPGEGRLMKGTLELNYLEITTLHCLEQMGCKVFGEDPRLIKRLGWIGKKWEEVAATYVPFDLENFDYEDLDREAV